MNAIALAAGVIDAEVKAAGKEGDPEWLAGAAMTYVQPRVRPWREAERVSLDFGFTTYPATILSSESGYCGSCILVWRAILAEHGIETRQIGFTWRGLGGALGHVCAEAYWNDDWHFFDVMLGTVWIEDGQVLPWERVRLNPGEAALRVSNTASIRYTGYESWFAVDPFLYLRVEPLIVEYLVADVPVSKRRRKSTKRASLEMDRSGR